MKTFTIGDKIQVIDDNLEGKVIGFDTDKRIQIETTDGFILSYWSKELIKINSNDTIIRFNKDIKDVLAEKEPAKKKNNLLKKDSKKEQMIFEVDLHLEKLMTGKTNHLSNFDKMNIQLDEAKKAVDYAISKRYQRVVLIHGVGEGVLKSEINFMLKRYENIIIQEANYSKYGQGATEIYIKQS